ncbi:MAG: radical SAM protein [Planctomycetota bacterium]|nr:radical SAM protein [Planctomycetota bacterium]
MTEKLEKQASELTSLSSPCVLCPHECGVKRNKGETGKCSVGYDPRIASWGSHFGEEPVLVGKGGSGTIFFAGCNVRCIFCQNYDVSHHQSGNDVTVSSLVRTMLALERIGCENINFVTPTQFAHAVFNAVRDARKQGLELPVVYNCGGYESVRTIRLLDEIVDIWMPDIKTLDKRFAEKYLVAKNYPEKVGEALKAMAEMQPESVVQNGVMRKGVIVRHLVMPNMLEDSKRILDMVTEHAPNALVNVMGQYQPYGIAETVDELSRPTSPEETKRARDYAASKGLALSS